MGRENEYKSWAEIDQEMCSAIWTYWTLDSSGNRVLQQWGQSTSPISTIAPLLQKSNGGVGAIKRFEKGSSFYEFRPTSGQIKGYDYRSNICPNTWGTDLSYTCEEACDVAIRLGYKLVAMNHDPNDLQLPVCKHEFEVSTDTCKNCGMHWESAMFGGKNCCQGGGFYTQGKWHSADCSKVSTPEILPSKTTPRRCTCGSSSLGSDRHSSYCDLYQP